MWAYNNAEQYGSTMVLELDTDVIGIGELIRQNRFSVPEHQRAYAWTSNEVADLWSDITQALTDEPAGYFVGQIVLGIDDDETNRKRIIDGQQRLATVSLLYAAIVSLLRSRDEDNGDRERADEFDRTFLATKDLLTLERTHRIELGPLDNAFFVSLLTAAATTSAVDAPTRESHRLLNSAYTDLRTRLDEYAPAGSPDWRERVVALALYVTTRVVTITVSAGTEDNAFLIFETLNDRGMQLTPSDLLKNLLFARSKTRLSEAQTLWSQMAGTLEAMSDDTSITQFIRHYWISSKGPVRDKQLYKTIKTEVTTPAQAIQLTTALAAAAKTYAAITNPDAAHWANSTERDAVRAVATMKAKTVRPLLLSIGQRKHSAQRTKLLTQTMKSTVRLAIAGRLGSGPTEDGVGECARKVRDGSVTSVAKLKTALGPAAVSDAEFKEAFETYRTRNSRQARFLLRAVEVQRRTDTKETVELTPSADETTVNLEHVLPRNPAPKTWTGFSADDVASHAYRLGNMVLLSKAMNAALKNGDFPTKEKVLAASELVTTSEVGDLPDWTQTTISERQKRLADTAVRVW